MSITKRLAISVMLALVTAGIYWAIRDIWMGEWVPTTAIVTGKHYVPDRSHWQTVGSVDANGQATTRQEYVSLPPEYHVFARDDDGEIHDLDDRWLFSYVENGMRVALKMRIGRSGWRWATVVDRERTQTMVRK